MIKAVNMKNYRFGKLANAFYTGFGMLDTDTEKFVSLDGIHPYVLGRKKVIQSIIDGGSVEHMPERAPIAAIVK